MMTQQLDRTLPQAAGQLRPASPLPAVLLGLAGPLTAAAATNPTPVTLGVVLVAYIATLQAITTRR